MIKRRFQMTRTAGYKEIPPHLIKEAARAVGLKKPPPVYVRKAEHSYLDCCPCCGWFIAIPRRLHKSKVPYDLRHEMAHYILRDDHELRLTVELTNKASMLEAAKLDTRQEMQAIALAEGKVTAIDLEILMEWAMDYFMVPEDKAVAMVMKEAKSQGISKRVIRIFRNGGN